MLIASYFESGRHYSPYRGIDGHMYELHSAQLYIVCEPSYFEMTHLLSCRCSSE